MRENKFEYCGIIKKVCPNNIFCKTCWDKNIQEKDINEEWKKRKRGRPKKK